MGIRFNTNTWRAPLLLIDCWLPQAAECRPSLPRALPSALQRFSRAGWLGRNSGSDSGISATPPSQARMTTRGPCHVRINNETSALSSGAPSARMVISGRIDDVCDELERLAALELQATTSRS